MFMTAGLASDINSETHNQAKCLWSWFKILHQIALTARKLTN